MSYVDISLNGSEAFALKTLVRLRQESHGAMPGVDLDDLYGRLNLAWAEASRVDRTLDDLTREAQEMGLYGLPDGAPPPPCPPGCGACEATDDAMGEGGR